MRFRDRIIRWLLRLYPAAWRREYGWELTDVLSRRRLTARTIVDVAWSAFVQRLREAEPTTYAGLVVMILVAIGVFLNVLRPASAGHGLAAIVQDSSKTLPTVVVTPLASNLYILLLIACGCWTYLRRDRSNRRCGRSAIRLSALAGIPVVLLGLLLLIGLIDLRVVGPNEPTPFVSPGLTYTYVSARGHVPSALAILTAPLFRLPEAWIWGLVGGRLGRAIARYWPSAATSSVDP
jgi:hypothetical protein